MMVGLRIAGGLAITIALATGLLVYPRVTRPVNAATSVHQALTRVNTWHLKGWIVQDGQHVPWEVWGRREPFFYREQVGSNIVLDDGRQRFSIYGPSPERNQLGGIGLLHPSLRDADNVAWSYSHMVLLWRNAGKPWKQTAQGPVFNFNAVNMDGDGVNTDHLYFVDGGTWLPTRYEKRTCHYGRETSRHTVALLDAEYDMPIPASASAAVTPPGYRVFDAMKTPDALPRKGVVTANGFTLHCQPLAMDRDGNVLVRLRGWLGNTIVPAGQGDVHFQAVAQRWASEAAMDPPVNYDDQGRAYVGVAWQALVEGNPDPNTYLMLFVPREPLPAGAAPPTTLTAKFDASVFAGWGTLGINLLREDMTVSTSLPEVGPPIAEAIGHYGTFDGHRRTINYGGYENLATAICRARARQYIAIRDARKPDTPEIRRYVYWMEQTIAAEQSLDVQRDRIDLARTYGNLGNATQSRRLLLDILNEDRFLKPQALPVDRSPAGFSEAEDQVRQWNQQYFREARAMLRTLDKAKTNAGGKR